MEATKKTARIKRVLSEEDVSRRSPAVAKQDLTPYLEDIQQIASENGRGAELTLDDGSQQRAEKRRYTLAAKELGWELTWRKAQPGELRFVLTKLGERVRRPRPKTDAGGG